MIVWRLLRLKTHGAFMNMATDEAILRARTENHVPNTIRFYRWKPSAVSIGRFQNVEDEVQLDNCREHHIDVVRRLSGGGAVYHDSKDEITYAVVADKGDFASDITGVYLKIYAGLAEAVKMLGLNADFSEGNLKTCPNLTINNKKISGSAQYHSKSFVLQHGTLLLDVDFDKMFTFLRVPWAKTSMEILEVAERRIGSLKKELRRDVSLDDAEEVLVKGFEKALNMKLVEDELTIFEKDLADRLCREKYTTDRWNFKGEEVTRERPDHSLKSSLP